MFERGSMWKMVGWISVGMVGDRELLHRPEPWLKCVMWLPKWLKWSLSNLSLQSTLVKRSN